MFKLPDDVSFKQAAAIMIKGLIAHMLVKQSHEVKAGETILIHAMTGGVETLLSNWVRAFGANVIGTVGSEAKKELALRKAYLGHQPAKRRLCANSPGTDPGQRC